MSNSDQSGFVKTPLGVYHREFVSHHKPRRTPSDELLKDIEALYPGIVVTHTIDQEVASQFDSMSEKTLEDQQATQSITKFPNM